MITKQQVTENLIIETGIKMITEMGYANATIAGICAKVGIGRSTFYNYFNGKEELVAAYYGRLSSYSPERMAWIFSAEHVSERIIRTHLALYSDLENNRKSELYALRIKHFIDKPANSNLKLTEQIEKILVPMITEAQKKGEVLNSSEAESLCRTAVTIQWGNILLWCISKENYNRVMELRKALEDLYNIREDLRSDELYL